MAKNPSMPVEANTLAKSINKLYLEGYQEDFRVADGRLISVQTKKRYAHDQVHIVNFFRFEGASDPSDNSILYAIETNDGAKGTLTDAYGPYADPDISKLIKQVEDISKKEG